MLYGTITGMDLAVDDTNPCRRIAFGSKEAAQAFVDSVTGWSLTSTDDPAQPPITGTWSVAIDVG